MVQGQHVNINKYLKIILFNVQSTEEITNGNPSDKISFNRNVACGYFVNNQDETLKFEVLLLIQQHK